MDGFEVRLQLVSILRKLSSSQNSIQSTIRFLLKHKDKYGDDLWDCLIEEAEKVNLNARINILYLIDGLLFTSSTALLTSHQDYQYHNTRTHAIGGPPPSINHPAPSAGFNYGYLIKRDIIRFVEIVVPTSFNKKGLLNLMSTLQVIKNWKSQVSLIDQFLNIDLLEQIDLLLNDRKLVLGKADVDHKGSDNELVDFSKKEILDRIDDDRERVESTLTTHDYYFFAKKTKEELIGDEMTSSTSVFASESGSSRSHRSPPYRRSRRRIRTRRRPTPTIARRRSFTPRYCSPGQAPIGRSARTSNPTSPSPSNATSYSRLISRILGPMDSKSSIGSLSSSITLAASAFLRIIAFFMIRSPSFKLLIKYSSSLR